MESIANWSYSQTTFYKKYSIKEGLLSSDNYRVTQDLDGYIWICSEAGVVKYDGIQFKKFTIKEGLEYNDVWEIHIDSKNRKWLNSFSNGMQYIENDVIKTIEPSLSIDQIYFAGEHEDTIFFYNGNELGLKRYYFAPDGKFGHYDRFQNLGYEVWGDFREEGKFILIPENRDTNYSLMVYDIKTGALSRINEKLLFAQERNMHEIDVFMYPTENKENKFLTWTKGKLKELNLNSEISNDINQIIYDPVSKYSFLKTSNWTYAYSNLKQLKRDEEVEAILNKQFPFPDKVEYIHIDRENNIWITELRGEVYFIPQMARWTLNSIMETSKPLDANISSILNYENHILFLSRSFKMYDYNKLEGKIDLINNNDRIFRDWKIRGDNLYVLFFHELCVYPISNNEGKLKVQWNKVVSHQVKNALTFDFLNDETVVLGNGRLLTIRNPQKSPKFRLNCPQRTNSIFISDSTIIYTYISGITIYDVPTKKEKKIDIRNAEFIKYVGKYLVVGTKGEGAYLLSKKGTEIKILKHLLTEYDINDVNYHKGVWCFATNRGVIAGKLSNQLNLQIESIHLKETILGLHINKISVDDAFIYAFTTKGMYTIDKRRFRNRKVNSIRYTTEMMWAGTILNDRKSIQLKSYQNYLSFSFLPVSFYDLGEKVFRYKLIGRNTSWQYTSELKVDFENLEPGDYQFIVEASENRAGVFSNRQQFSFYIDTPIYDKLWFQLLMALFGILLIFLSVMIARRVTARKQLRKTKMKNIELKALRAQLNPHFVFNSLNTIQSMIILRSEREANEYIVSFAELMRKVLDNSNYERVSLKNEIDFLENYLMLENIRINYTLDYEISFEKDLNLSEIMVYSMVYQPIVENVLVHAFLTNQSDKQLDISFSVENEMLTATITDNGIGREKSAELNKNKVHKSWASTILNEKAELLNEMKKKELSIEIIDLYDDGVAMGTKVIVNMRIIRKKEIQS